MLIVTKILFKLVNPYQTNSLFLHQQLMIQAISFAGTGKSESVKHISRLTIDLEKIEFISYSEFVLQIFLEEIIGDFLFSFKGKPHKFLNLDNFNLINLISKTKLQNFLFTFS